MLFTNDRETISQPAFPHPTGCILESMVKPFSGMLLPCTDL